MVLQNPANNQQEGLEAREFRVQGFALPDPKVAFPDWALLRVQGFRVLRLTF